MLHILTSHCCNDDKMMIWRWIQLENSVQTDLRHTYSWVGDFNGDWHPCLSTSKDTNVFPAQFDTILWYRARCDETKRPKDVYAAVMPLFATLRLPPLPPRALLPRTRGRKVDRKPENRERSARSAAVTERRQPDRAGLYRRRSSRRWLSTFVRLSAFGQWLASAVNDVMDEVWIAYSCSAAETDAETQYYYAKARSNYALCCTYDFPVFFALSSTHW